LVCGAGRVRAGTGPSPCDHAGLAPSISPATIKIVFLDVMVLSRLLLGRSLAETFWRFSRQPSLPHLFTGRFPLAGKKSVSNSGNCGQALFPGGQGGGSVAWSRNSQIAEPDFRASLPRGM
jgi:hypothetical protein